MIHELAKNVTGTGDQTSVFRHGSEAVEGLFQVSMTSGTVVLKGRSAAGAAWQTIMTTTNANDAQIVALFPEMKVTLTSGVAVYAYLTEPG